MGAAHMHVHRGFFQASAEEARLREDGNAREPPFPDAEAALHQCVAVPGPRRPVVAGCRCEVPGVDVGRGVGRAQGRVSPVRQRMVELPSLCDRAVSLYGGGPQVKVAIMTGDDEVGVAGARRLVLQDGVLGHLPVRLVQQRVAVKGGCQGKSEWVLNVVPAHAQAVLKPPQGHLIDRLRRARRERRVPLGNRVPQEVEDDLGVNRIDPRSAGAVLQG